jgi:hypothetical protein
MLIDFLDAASVPQEVVKELDTILEVVQNAKPAMVR